jgi:hypothetical protein
MEKNLILLRGLPNSGKSTAAKLFNKDPHFEADMFFLDANGDYEFDITKIKEAHNWCRNSVMDDMKKEYPFITLFGISGFIFIRINLLWKKTIAMNNFYAF